MSDAQVLVVSPHAGDLRALNAALQTLGRGGRAQGVATVEAALSSLAREPFACVVLSDELADAADALFAALREVPSGTAGPLPPAALPAFSELPEGPPPAPKLRIPVVVLCGGAPTGAARLIRAGAADVLLREELTPASLEHALAGVLAEARGGRGPSPGEDTLALTEHRVVVGLFADESSWQRLVPWLRSLSLEPIRVLTPQQAVEMIEFQTPEAILCDDCLLGSSFAAGVVDRLRATAEAVGRRILVVTAAEELPTGCVALPRPVTCSRLIAALLAHNPGALYGLSGFLRHLELKQGLPPGRLALDPDRGLFALAEPLGWEPERFGRELAEFLDVDFRAAIPTEGVDFSLLPASLWAAQVAVPIARAGERPRLFVADPFRVQMEGLLAHGAFDVVITTPSALARRMVAPSASTDFALAREARVPRVAQPRKAHAPREEEAPSFDGYHIDRVLGRGGMGTVYLATQLRLQRQVALKVLRLRGSGEHRLRERFEREARVLATLDHPAIIPIYDVFEGGGFLCIVMAFAFGGSVRGLLDRARRPLDAGLAAQLVLEAAAGLQAAAERGVIHRDIKPENLLLNEVGEVRLGDFGLARSRFDRERLTRSGLLLGTPSYMAPEYWTDGTADHRSDLYALGCTLYELLSGAVPFVGDKVHVMLQHLGDRPQPLSRLRPELPPALAGCVERLLVKEPRQRIQTGAELVELLRPFAHRPHDFNPNTWSRIDATAW